MSSSTLEETGSQAKGGKTESRKAGFEASADLRDGMGEHVERRKTRQVIFSVHPLLTHAGGLRVRRLAANARHRRVLRRVLEIVRRKRQFGCLGFRDLKEEVRNHVGRGGRSKEKCQPGEGSYETVSIYCVPCSFAFAEVIVELRCDSPQKVARTWLPTQDAP